MICFPPCKINLGLFVTRKRDDGYHDLESVFLPVPWTDVLEVVPSDTQECEFSSSGLQITGPTADNLVVRAWQLIRREYGIGGVHVHLHKVIPMGAGLGGGSSDAASMLIALNEIFMLELDRAELEGHAASLGSDCPFFIRNRPQFITGRGELMQDLSAGLFRGWIAIHHPPVHVSTAQAYGLIKPQPAPFDLRRIHELPPEKWQSVVSNDFQVPVASQFCGIADALKAMLAAGAVYTAMSGSGSAVFGLFSEKPELPAAYVGEVAW